MCFATLSCQLNWTCCQQIQHNVVVLMPCSASPSQALRSSSGQSVLVAPHTRFKTGGDRAFLAVEFSLTVFTLTPLILLKRHFYRDKLSTNLLFSCWILVFYIVICCIFIPCIVKHFVTYLWKRGINKFYLLYCHHVNLTV